MLPNKFKHTPTDGWPGSQYRVSQAPITEAHSAFTPSMFLPGQYHVLVKYAYAKAVIEENDDLQFWMGVYHKMQLKRCGFSKRHQFNKLIKSMEKVGFDGDNPIPLTTNGLEILDGSHRLGASLALSYWPVVEVYSAESHPYDRSWFVDTGFSSEEISRIDQAQQALERTWSIKYGSTRTIIIWGNALGSWSHILEMLSEQHKLISGIWLDFGSAEEAERFTISSYEGDGMPKDRIAQKAQRLSKMSSRAGLITIEEPDDRKLTATKNSIRAIVSPRVDEYFFDSIIHVIDSLETGYQLVRNYLPYQGGLQP